MIPGHIGIMAEVRDDTCEVKVGGAWTLITMEDALKLDADKKKRCPACHGRVRAFHASINGMRAHFEHYVAHPVAAERLHGDDTTVPVLAAYV
jgi:hypothetical protein